MSLDGIDGSEDTHLQIDGGLFHEVVSLRGVCRAKTGLKQKPEKPTTTSCVVADIYISCLCGREGSALGNRCGPAK
jgi:hypothetical protein